MNAALRRMGYGKDEVTAHGFRVTASTLLNARDYDPDVLKLCWRTRTRTPSGGPTTERPIGSSGSR
jgi:hypothetical protein